MVNEAASTDVILRVEKNGNLGQPRKLSGGEENIRKQRSQENQVFHRNVAINNTNNILLKFKHKEQKLANIC